MSLQLHVVAGGEEAGTPLLVARAPDAGPVAVPLEGDFAWRLSGERHCVGRWHGAEAHRWAKPTEGNP